MHISSTESTPKPSNRVDIGFRAKAHLRRNTVQITGESFGYYRIRGRRERTQESTQGKADVKCTLFLDR